MHSVIGNNGSENELVFEQRTPSTMRGSITLRLEAPQAAATSEGDASFQASPVKFSARVRSSYPKHFLWRLRTAEGSAMLCSKLCGLLTVTRPGDVALEKVSITLAVRLSSLSSSMSDLDPATGGTTLTQAQLPSYLRKESKLRVQWLELGHHSNGHSSGTPSTPGRQPEVNLDYLEAEKALQSATRDRTLLDSMFRVGAARVHVSDIACTFSVTPSSSRSTGRFSSSRSNGSTIDIQGSERDFARGASVLLPIPPQSRGASPISGGSPSKADRPQGASLSPLPAVSSAEDLGEHHRVDGSAVTATASASTTSGAANYPAFWVGVAVGTTFGVTAGWLIASDSSAMVLERLRGLQRVIVRDFSAATISTWSALSETIKSFLFHRSESQSASHREH